ncbi:MAG: hypothetical protein QF834_07325 [Candidatus Thalassarchaeaceae archaeon]|jgi:hypothetical protein|nr:hypothetical protein [Candidatus Thalassarchaeaceae archaeon]
MRTTGLAIGILVVGTTLGGSAGATGHPDPDSLAFGPVRLGTTRVDTVRVVKVVGVVKTEVRAS